MISMRQALSETHPQLAAQLVDQDLASLHGGSSVIAEWICDVGHITSAMIRAKTQNAGGCAICTGKKILRGFNDLATTNPTLATELVDQDLATTLAGGSHSSALWRCAAGHEWMASVQNRTTGGRSKNGTGCPVCAGQQVQRGFNDIATTHPHLVRELVNPEIGFEESVGSRRKVDWRCSVGHEWTRPISYRTVHGHGCPVCSGREHRAGINDLATTHPEIADQLIGFDPTTNQRWSTKDWS